MRMLQKQLDNLKDWMESRDDLPRGWIYLGDDKVRYLLGQPGVDNMLVFGVNPSTAVPGKDDPTIRKVRKIVEHDGYDGWIMVNLYPMISSDPKDLPEEPDKRLIERNLRILQAVVEAYPVRSIWAAWGDVIDSRLYLGEILFDIQDKLKTDAQWFYRGKMTRRGKPRHPLYMKLDVELSWLPVFDYASDCIPFNVYE